MLIWIKFMGGMGMNEYNIEITETLSRVVTVKADNIHDAISNVTARYKSGEIVLDEQDYKGCNIEPYGD